MNRSLSAIPLRRWCHGLAGLLPLALLVVLSASSAAGNLPPLQAVSTTIDLERYTGKWYVQGNIPVRIPFFNDADAYNYIERYELLPDGSVQLECEFNDGGLQGKPVRTSFRAVVAEDSGNASWIVRPVWPIKLNYLIVHLSPDYAATIVGMPSRRWGWIMTREAQISDDHYNSLLQVVSELGYEPAKFRRVAHANRNTT